MLFELINPSDPYTFRAPSIEVAGAAVALLSPSFGAVTIGEEPEQMTPVLFGWEDWLKERGIDDSWVSRHRGEIADALDSFLIGSARHRADVESMLSELPAERRQAWRAERQDRHRSSTNKIGEYAYDLARRLRGRQAYPRATPP